MLLQSLDLKLATVAGSCEYAPEYRVVLSRGFPQLVEKRVVIDTKSRQRVAYKHSTRSWNDYPSRLHWDLLNKILKCERSSPSAHREQSEREIRSLRAMLKATALGTEKRKTEGLIDLTLVDKQTAKKPVCYPLRGRTMLSRNWSNAGEKKGD
jgi:hypothetical protein